MHIHYSQNLENGSVRVTAQGGMYADLSSLSFQPFLCNKSKQSIFNMFVGSFL